MVLSYYTSSVEGVRTLKKLLSIIALLFAFLWFAPSAHAQATSPVYSSGGPSGAAHRMPHDIAFSTTPSGVQGGVRTTITNWANTPMTRLVCAEAFHTTTNAKTHLGCLTVHLNTTEKSSYQFDVPTMNLSSGTHRIVYTYQDAGGFWHQMTNTSDKLVRITHMH